MSSKKIIISSVLGVLLIVLLVNREFRESISSGGPKYGQQQTEQTAVINKTSDSSHQTSQKTGPPQPVFTPDEQKITENEQDGHWKGLKGTALRSQVYSLGEPIWSREILAVGKPISLRLFDDVEIQAEVTSSFQNINGTISTIAKVTGSRWGRVFIAQTNGEVRAKITVPEENKMYGIHFNPDDGNHYALELDISLEQTDDAGPHRTAPTKKVINDDDELSLLMNQDLLESDPIALADESVAATVVDIMVVYSNDALAAAGSSSDNMNNVIALGMLMANDAHTNTNTGIVFNLIYSVQVAYDDSGNQDTDLDRLTYTGGSYSDMDVVQTWRETYGADFVSLMIGTGGGLAWKLTSSSGSADYAFSVIGYPSFDSYTPVHEIGHNMGLSHAYDQNAQPGPTGGTIGTDAAGWHWHPTPGADGYCSVMTYTGGSYFADGLDHIRVGLFSDPNITDHGEPAGHITLANNARVLRDLKNIYAAYRSRDIPASSIKVDYPNGSEQVKEGEDVHIMWDSNGIAGNVKIDLYESNIFKQTIAADTLNDRVYEWTVPANLSGNTFEIRISSVADSTKYDESDNFFSITESIYADTLDSSPGYTITGTNGWEYGAWTTATDQYGGPSSPYTGTNLYDTNLNGASFSTTTLTTQAIACSNYQEVRLGFAGWFSVAEGYRVNVQVSNDYSIWNTIYSQDGEHISSAWTVYDFDISAYADGESTVYIRWTHEDTDLSQIDGNYAGMSVDDIKISGINVPAVDTLAPVFTWVPANMIVKTASPAQTSTIVNWIDPTATDNVDGPVIPIQTGGPPKGSAFSLGTYTITYQATDSTGNNSTASFTVTVVPGSDFPWTMFLPAILTNAE